MERGKWVNTAGHPIYWFNFGDDAAYEIRNQVFHKAENEFPDLGYMFFDEYASIANELFDICNLNVQYYYDKIEISFEGQSTLNETLILQPISPDNITGIITIDGFPVNEYRVQNSKLKIILDNLDNKVHKIIIPYITNTNIKSDESGIEVFPNPVREGEKINILNVQKDSKVYIINIEGRVVKTIGENSNYRNLIWDLTNNDYAKVASGVYFIVENKKDKRLKIKKVAIIK